MLARRVGGGECSFALCGGGERSRFGDWPKSRAPRLIVCGGGRRIVMCFAGGGERRTTRLAGGGERMRDLGGGECGGERLRGTTVPASPRRSISSCRSMFPCINML